MNVQDLYSYIEHNVDGYHKYLIGSNEIVIRCPFCGDSTKHTNKGHFYIGQKVEGSFLYQCKRAECGVQGQFNKRTLDILGINDITFISDLLAHNNSIRTNCFIRTEHAKYTNKNNTFSNYNFNNLDLKMKYYNKMIYLNSRIYKNANEKYQDLEMNLNDYRIIVSIKHFIDTHNLLEKLTNKQRGILDLLEDKFIGFLNMPGSVISFRSIDNNIPFRYYKMKFNDITDVYAIKDELDLFNLNKVNINICEGSFDIINIKNRLHNKMNRNDIYLSANSGDYITKVDYIVKHIGILNLHINIYRDSDVPLYRIKKQFDNTIYKDCYSVFSNSLGKDYSEEEIYIIKDY